MIDGNAASSASTACLRRRLVHVQCVAKLVGNQFVIVVKIVHEGRMRSPHYMEIYPA